MTTTTAPILPAHLVGPLETHAFSETATEVGGVLIGTLTPDGVTITGFIPALKAAGAATHVTFTHDVWADVLDTVERDHPGEQIVGWYHTHPSFGLFLSEYDLFIHRNFFADPRMPALVIDPVAGEMGWFGWSGGDIVELDRRPTQQPAIEHAVDAQARTDKRTAHRGRILLAIGAASVVGGAAAFVAGTVAADQGEDLAAAAARIGEQEQQLREQEATIADLQAQVGQLQEQPGQPAPDTAPPSDSTSTDSPAVVTVVQPGDSWWSLADRFYGDGARYPGLQAANPDISGLDPDDQVVIPTPTFAPLPETQENP